MFDFFKKKISKVNTEFARSSQAKYEELKQKHQSLDSMYELTKVGIEFEDSGDIESAIKVYEDLIASKWDGRDIYKRLSDIYISRGQNADAIRILQAYIDICKGKGNYAEAYKKKIQELRKAP